MTTEVEYQPWHMLTNAVLAVMSSMARLVILVATFLSETEERKVDCLSFDDYVEITGLPMEQVKEHVKILCEANLLKPVGRREYDITEFGRLTLEALAVTDDLVMRYIQMHKL